MKKSVIFVSMCSIVLTLCSYAFSQEYVTPVFDNRSWELGFSQNQGEVIFEEYVLVGESVENWSELVSIQFFPGLQKTTNPDIFEAAMHRDLVLICPSVEWVSIYQSADERIWEWNIVNCQGQPAQSEIARLKVTDKGFHVWHYAIKEAPMSLEKKETWLENLKKIQVVDAVK